MQPNNKTEENKSQKQKTTALDKWQDKTTSVDGLRCILYDRIYMPYMHTILYYYIQTGRPPIPISSELKLKTNSWLAQYLSNLFLKELTESASTT